MDEKNQLKERIEGDMELLKSQSNTGNKTATRVINYYGIWLKFFNDDMSYILAKMAYDSWKGGLYETKRDTNNINN
jgi:hypothetical protein